MTNEELFFQHIAQTSDEPMGLEIVKAEGVKMWDVAGKEYLDMISGVCVCNAGHCHPEVVKAVQQQAERYMHVMVYGEFVEAPQVQYAKALTDTLPASLNNVYFCNSGTEALEGALKLAKRVTGRPDLVSFVNSYHGGTHGALSLMGNAHRRSAFYPLLPGVSHLRYNHFEDLKNITEHTAAVVAEPVQSGSGFTIADIKWLQNLRKRCSDVGALLILDEIQSGMGRSGKMWAFEHFDIVPDILLVAKSLGGGLPLGAFIADKARMEMLTYNPELGHVNTFGGNPVSCAAGLASFKILQKENLVAGIREKEIHLRRLLKHKAFKAVRSFGLLIALEFENGNMARCVIDTCKNNGLICDSFLFAPHCIRLTPPLNITGEEIEKACELILKSVEEAGS